MPFHLSRRQLALGALGILAFAWGYNWVVMKIAVGYAPPFVFAAMRTLGGSLVLFVVMALMRRSLRPQYPVAYCIFGVLQTSGFLGLVTWAIVDAGVGSVAVLSYAMPVWTAMLAWPLLGERLTTRALGAIVLAVLGIGCLLGPAVFHTGWRADLLALLAGISWAGGVVYAKHFTRTHPCDVLEMTTWQMCFGGVVLGVVALVVPASHIVWSSAFIFALAYNVVIATALAYLLWVFVLATLTARDASMGTLSNPIIGVFGAWLQLGERPTALDLVGMGCIVAGLGILALGSKSERAT